MVQANLLLYSVLRVRYAPLAQLVEHLTLNQGSIPARVTKKKRILSMYGDKEPYRVGVDDAEGPPVPMPNTEVKLSSAEDT